MGIHQLLLGGSGGVPRVALDVTSAVSFTTVTPTAVAKYRLVNTGRIEATSGDNTLLDLGAWLDPGATANEYECRATVFSGSLTSGTTGSWLNLGTTREWSLTGPAFSGQQTCLMTLQIRRASDGEILASETISFTAETN
jgi:hypothetical protein